jgi:hypothetical protein
MNKNRRLVGAQLRGQFRRVELRESERFVVRQHREAAAVRFRTQQGENPYAALSQFRQHGRADEAGGAR